MRMIRDKIKLSKAGKKGGGKGGRARAENLSQAERSASAKKAAQARWAKKKGKE
jgi:hypothetical protein